MVLNLQLRPGSTALLDLGRAFSVTVNPASMCVLRARYALSVIVIPEPELVRLNPGQQEGLSVLLLFLLYLYLFTLMSMSLFLLTAWPL